MSFYNKYKIKQQRVEEQALETRDQNLKNKSNNVIKTVT